MADADTIYRVAWLLLHDRVFLHRHRELNPRVFPLGPLRYLVDLAIRTYVEHRTPLSQSIVDLSVEGDAQSLRRFRTDAPMARQVFRDLAVFAIEEASLEPARNICEAWLERRSVLYRVEAAASAIDKGEIAEAEEILRRQDRADDREEPASVMANFAYDHAQAQTRGSKGAIPLGLWDLDKAWRGGYRRGEIGLVGAPTGVGKSQILCMLAAEAFWKQKLVLYYTFELTVDQIKERVRCGILKKGRYDIDLEHLDEEWARAMRENGVSEIRGDVQVQGGPLTWPELREDLDHFKEKNGRYPGLLLLDSADDLHMPGKWTAEWQALKALYRDLRSMAQELRVPIWTSAQLTREAVDKARVNLRHIGGAFAKAQLCHYVLGVAKAQDETLSEPQLYVYILKDSLHGTQGAALQCKAAFGEGDNGYPYLEMLHAQGLPIIVRRDEP